MRRTILLASLPFFGLAPPSGTPARAPSLELQAPADSGRVLRSALAEQRRFEVIRRNHLPWTWDRGSGPCDELIGRFCIWHSEGAEPWAPPPDAPPVIAARTRLLDALAHGARTLPGDRWISGQRVRYLLEAGDGPAAIRAARECRSPEPAWCQALLGYALHGAGEYVAADSAFGEALARLPERDRQRWTDVSDLLGSPDARRYRRLRGEERDAFDATFWWLADPLRLVPGNDRRTEHFARHVVDRLQDRAGTTEGIAWGSDLRQLLVRYGSPAGWERIRDRFPGLQERRMVTRYPSGSRRFVPSTGFVHAPFEIPREGWDLEPRRARSGYAPAYVDSVLALDHQLAAFRRGDSVRLIAAFDPPVDARGDPAHSLALLHVGYAPDDHRQVSSAARSTVVLDLTVPPTPGVVSVEALAGEARLAARARYGWSPATSPPGRPALSDLLLLHDRGPLEDSLDALLARARPGNRVSPGERIAVYWELYEGGRTEEIGVEVQLVGRGTGALRRAGERIGLLHERTPLVVRWQEEPERTRVVSRAFSFEVPRVSPGRYALQLTVTVPGYEPAVAGADLEVGPATGAD
jgi:hypothetical protein